jgi:hypothetical protein
MTFLLLDFLIDNDRKAVVVAYHFHFLKNPVVARGQPSKIVECRLQRK